MTFTSITRRAAFVSLAVAGMVVGCSKDGVTPPGPQGLSLDQRPPGRGPSQGLELCKAGAAGKFDFTASVSPAGTGTLYSSAFSIVVPPSGAQTCFVLPRLWETEGSFDVTVTVTEDVPDGMEVSKIEVNEIIHDATTGDHLSPPMNITVHPGAATFDANFVKNDDIEVLKVVTFFNREVTGLQGCTPGYWKQQQHFGSWNSTGLNPSDSYNTTFGVTAWPATFTLLDALGQNGGGINRLARHSTAALLNARSSEVAYGITSQEVIQRTRAAIASGDYDSASDVFEPLNENGCPLGRNE
jgi:hypothetical protein